MDTPLLNYEITGGPSFAVVKVMLKPGEQVVAEAGAMAYMDGTVEMKTSAKGGFFKGLSRKFSGESFFMNTFTGPGMVAFDFPLSGDILALELPPDQPWILSKDAFIAGTPNINLSSKFGGLASMFGGEGAFLTKITAEGSPGLAFIGSYGAVDKRVLAPNEELVVDNGLFLATEMSTSMKISKVGGMKSLFFGGEGVVMRFRGPGTVYMQTRSTQGLLNLLSKIIPSG